MMHSKYKFYRPLVQASKFVRRPAMIVALCLGAGQCLAQVAEEGEDIVLGFTPVVTAEHIQQMGTILTRMFTAAAGRPVVLRSKPSMQQFEAALARGNYALAILHPRQYLRFSAERGWKPLLKTRYPLVGVLIAKGRGTPRPAQWVAGKRIAFPPSDLSTSLAVKVWLADRKLIAGRDYHIDWVGSNSACVRSVVLSRSDACLVSGNALALMPPEVMGDIHVVHVMDLQAPMVVAAPPSMSDETVSQLVAGALKWQESALANGARIPDVVLLEPARDADFDHMRRVMNRASELCHTGYASFC